MLAKLKRLVIRLRQNRRARRAKRRLIAGGTIGRVSAAANALSTDPFKNIMRKQVEGRAASGKPFTSAQEIGDYAMKVLERGWGLDLSDVSLAVEVDQWQENLELTAVPSIEAAQRAHGGHRG